MDRSAVQRWETRGGVPAIAASLLCLALAPAWLRAHGDGVAAMAVIAFFSKLCHQRPDRVFYLFGAPTGVCVRCLGIYAGVVVGGFVRFSPNIALRCLTAALVLNILDVLAETLGLHGNLPLLRFLIGAAIGIAVGAIFTIKFSADSPSHMLAR